jgi:hypothetical protein
MTESLDNSELGHDGEKDLKLHNLSDDAALPEEYPSAINLVLMFIALILAMFLASLDFTIVGTAIPKITEQFHALDSVRRATQLFISPFR